MKYVDSQKVFDILAALRNNENFKNRSISKKYRRTQASNSKTFKRSVINTQLFDVLDIYFNIDYY